MIDIDIDMRCITISSSLNINNKQRDGCEARAQITF